MPKAQIDPNDQAIVEVVLTQLTELVLENRTRR